MGHRRGDASALAAADLSPETEVTLRAVADAMISQGRPYTNYGRDAGREDTEGMRVGYEDRANPNVGAVRSLVRFDTSSIPPGATVTKALLRLHFVFWRDVPGRFRTVTTHRITASWSEDTVTWHNSPGHVGAYGSVSLPANEGDQSAFHDYDWDVTPLVQDWTSGSLPNHGILLRSGEQLGMRGFGTREGGAEYTPRLVVLYARGSASTPTRPRPAATLTATSIPPTVTKTATTPAASVGTGPIYLPLVLMIWSAANGWPAPVPVTLATSTARPTDTPYPTATSSPVPTDTPPPTNTPLPTATLVPQQRCTDPIQNGNFEQGPGFGWLESSAANEPIVRTEQPYEGRYGAWLCGYNNAEDLIVAQRSIPNIPASQLVSATIEFHLGITSQELREGLEVDRLLLAFVDDQIEKVEPIDQWSEESLELGSWYRIHGDVTHLLTQRPGWNASFLSFFAKTDFSLVTSFFVDNVSLTICTRQGAFTLPLTVQRRSRDEGRAALKALRDIYPLHRTAPESGQLQAAPVDGRTFQAADRHTGRNMEPHR